MSGSGCPSASNGGATARTPQRPALLARSRACGDTLVVAALLHDIGQLMGDPGDTGVLLGVDPRHGVCSAEEVRALEAEPYSSDAVTLQGFSDAGERADG